MIKHLNAVQHNECDIFLAHSALDLLSIALVTVLLITLSSPVLHSLIFVETEKLPEGKVKNHKLGFGNTRTCGSQEAGQEDPAESNWKEFHFRASETKSS